MSSEESAPLPVFALAEASLAMNGNGWNRPVPSSALTERMTCPAAFRNYEFLNLLCSVDLSLLHGAARLVQRRLAVVFRGYSWPLYVAEIDPFGDAFRLAIFRDDAGPSAGGHYGGEASALSAEEWELVSAEVGEAALATGVELVEQDAEGRGWVVASRAPVGRSADEVRELRAGTMARMTAAFRTVWPEGWLDRHAGEAGCGGEVEARASVEGPRSQVERSATLAADEAALQRYDGRPGHRYVSRALPLPASPGLARAAMLGIVARGRPSQAADARSRAFWAAFRAGEARDVAEREPAVSFRRPLDWEREWNVRYLPPSDSEISAARATIAEVTAWRAETDRLAAPLFGPPGRVRSGGPFRE